MKRFLYIGLVTVFVWAALPALATAAENFKDVVVRNTVDEPIPVQGVGIQQVGGSIGLDPGANTVRIAGSPTVRTVQALPQPFTSSALPAFNSPKKTVATVPDGKQLVIEFASMTVDVGDGVGVDARLDTIVGGRLSFTNLSIEPVYSRDGFTHWVLSQELRVYADPGTEVQAFVRTRGSAGGGLSALNLTGYLVDVS